MKKDLTFSLHNLQLIIRRQLIDDISRIGIN